MKKTKKRPLFMKHRVYGRSYRKKLCEVLRAQNFSNPVKGKHFANLG